MTVQLINGDMLAALDLMPSYSFHACVTDPPYHLTSIVKRFGAEDAAPALSNGPSGVYARASAGFMGKQWDGGDIAFQASTWAAVRRVLKPGGHLLAFGGTRTWHRMAVAIEDAGFEIRDCVMWLYGKGFPKSHAVDQSIEKLLTTGKARRPDRDLGGLSRNRFSGSEEGTLIADTGGAVPLTTEEALAWQGWGTALKPAWEPIIVARVPLIGTVAANVLAHGCGGLNIDGCRLHAPDAQGSPYKVARRTPGARINAGEGWRQDGVVYEGHTKPGRWPANVAHDGSDEVEDAFAAFGANKGAAAPVRGTEPSAPIASVFNPTNRVPGAFHGDTGSASRFFYCGKATAADRAGSKHPTVKPVSLLRWLVRLVTPPGGHILDPFAGSGTTGAAALAEGFSATLIEADPEYQADLARRFAVSKMPMDVFA